MKSLFLLQFCLKTNIQKKKKKAKKAALDLYLGETVAPAFQAELF